MNVPLDKFQQDLQKNYLAFKKASDQLKKDYAKVSNESYTEKEWNTEGKRITINMNSFQKLMKDLTKKVEYVTSSNIEDKRIQNAVKTIEPDLKTARTNLEPMIIAIKNKINTYANDFQMAANQEQEKEEVQEQLLTTDLLHNKEYLEERRKNLEDIHRTAAEMKDLTDLMAQNVNEQGLMLDEVEKNVNNAEQNAEKAKHEITEADKLSKGNTKCINLLIIGIVVAIAGIGIMVWLVIKYTKKEKTNPFFILVGFGHFSATTPSEPTFRVYFRRIFGKGDLPDKTSFNININYKTESNRLRILEEKQESKCNKVNSNDNNNIQYDCSFPVDESKNLGDITTSGDFKFKGKDLKISSLANKTMIEGLQNAVETDLDDGFIVLEQAQLSEEKDEAFTLKGKIEEKFDEDKITLYFDDKGEGNIKESKCTVVLENEKEQKFKFDCIVEKGLIASLTGVIGKTEKNKKLVISIKDGTKDILHGKEPSKKSGKLSGWAIAGIVIGSVLVVLIIAFLVIRMMIGKSNN